MKDIKLFDRSIVYLWHGLLLIIFFFSSQGLALSKPCIVASIFPFYDIAKKVGEPKAEVYLLLPPGADPHSWEPTPKDMLLLYRANILFVSGGGLEPWFEDLKRGLQKRHQKILVAIEGAPLLNVVEEPSHHHNRVDPHIWLDFRWDAVLAKRLADLLGEIDPQNREFYHNKALILANKFLELDNEYSKKLSHCNTRKLVLAGHAAFAYLARAYKLETISLAGLSPEAEPTPKTLVKMINFVRHYRLTAIFYEHPSSKRFAEMIARETNVKVFYLTPGASLTKEEVEAGLDLFDLMHRNLKYLVEGLSCH